MAITNLSILFRACLHKRIGADTFHKLLQQFSISSSPASREIISAFLNCSVSFCVEGDPLLQQYLQVLIVHNFVHISELVAALLLQWTSIQDEASIVKIGSIHTRLVTDLNVIVATTGQSEGERCILLTSQWLKLLAQSDKKSADLADAVGFLLVTCLNSNSSIISEKNIHNAVQSALDQCMSVFPNVSMQLMAKLTTMPKPADSTQGPESSSMMTMAAFEFESGIHDTSIVASRQASTIYLNSLLRTGATIDESVLFSFFNTRHQGNHAMMFNDLVLASFDAMAKTHDSSTETYQTQCSVFILNKLPSVLAFVVTSAFESFSSENLLIDSWRYLNNTAAEYVVVGKRFLQLCTLYHLISPESLTTAIGSDTSTLKGLYAKDDLISQVTANHSRGPRLVEELLKNDGNAGTISQAILEILHTYCHAKETQHLKDMANAIVRKPAAINSICVFVRPSTLLNPICSLLDEWKWSEIHGESQPVYVEFGSIFLLVLATKQRLKLSLSELGVSRNNGFLAKYFATRHAEYDLIKLAESTRTHLGDWISALYIDEGLSDDLTTNCSAQDFYLLLPTLLDQSILAYSRGRLNNDTLKAGLEYLLDPFLIPSLLRAFDQVEYLIDREPKAVTILIQTLTKQPSVMEVREIHQTILSMAFERLQTRDFSRHPALMDIIAMHKSSFSIVSYPAETDLELWRSSEGGLKRMLTQAIVGQARGSGEKYNATLLEGALRIHGPRNFVKLCVDLLLQFSGTHEFHLMLDVVASIMASENHGMRSTVQLCYADLASHLKKGESLVAEVIVHLYRRVGLYNTALAAQDLGMDHSFVPLAGLNVANVNLDAGVTAVFDQNAQAQNEDIDQVLNEAAVMGGMDSVDNNGFDEMYGLSGDLGLGSLDDLDLEMF